MHGAELSAAEAVRTRPVEHGGADNQAVMNVSVSPAVTGDTVLLLECQCLQRTGTPCKHLLLLSWASEDEDILLNSLFIFIQRGQQANVLTCSHVSRCCNI